MRKEWSDEETELLKEKYNTVSNEELLKLFPERTYISIYKKARKLGIYKNKNIEFINRSIARKEKRQVIGMAEDVKHQKDTFKF